MNDNDVIKALRCCGRESCNDCPYRNGKCHQGNPMIRDALDLINRLQAEIERLTNENAILSINADNAFQEGLNENRQLFKNEVEAEIKSEARKEFGEKIKGILSMNINISNTDYADIADDIDNLLAEMDGKENV